MRPFIQANNRDNGTVFRNIQNPDSLNDSVFTSRHFLTLDYISMLLISFHGLLINTLPTT